MVLRNNKNKINNINKNSNVCSQKNIFIIYFFKLSFRFLLFFNLFYSFLLQMVCINKNGGEIRVWIMFRFVQSIRKVNYLVKKGDIFIVF